MLTFGFVLMTATFLVDVPSIDHTYQIGIGRRGSDCGISDTPDVLVDFKPPSIVASIVQVR